MCRLERSCLCYLLSSVKIGAHTRNMLHFLAFWRFQVATLNFMFLSGRYLSHHSGSWELIYFEEKNLAIVASLRALRRNHKYDEIAWAPLWILPKNDMRFLMFCKRGNQNRSEHWFTKLAWGAVILMQTGFLVYIFATYLDTYFNYYVQKGSTELSWEEETMMELPDVSR